MRPRGSVAAVAVVLTAALVAVGTSAAVAQPSDDERIGEAFPEIVDHSLGVPVIGFDPDSPICVEYGAGDTPFLRELNDEPTPGPTEYMMIRNGDVSFVFVDEQDGTVPPVPARNRRGEPEDLSASAALPGADEVVLAGRYDDAPGDAPGAPLPATGGRPAATAVGALVLAAVAATIRTPAHRRPTGDRP